MSAALRFRVLGALLFASLATAASSEAADPFADFRYSQPIEVERPGWVAVELGSEATVHAATDLRLYGPDGLSVPLRLAPDRRPRRMVEVIEVASAGMSWRLDLDLGESPPAHDQLAFRFVRQVNASGVELEASDDRQTWRPIASANLFRLGEDSGLRRQTIDYPLTKSRYLRLRWPAAAGTPELESATVRIASVSGGGAGGSRTVDADCRQEPPAALVCRLPLPRPSELIERLEVEVESAGAGPYDLHLLVGEEGRWRSVGQVEARGVARKAFGLDVTPSASFARLELRGSGGHQSDLRLRSASTRSATRTVLFRASSSGSHTLVFGHQQHGLSSSLAMADTLPERVQWLQAGALVIRPQLADRLPDRPAAADRRAADIGSVIDRWPVVGGGSGAGDLVRLEVPTIDQRETQKLHLLSGDRSVPLSVERQAEPRLVHRWIKLPMERRDGVAVWRLDSSAGSGIDELVLRDSGPFERHVVVSWQDQPAITGRDPRFYTRHRSAWSCQRLPSLPCELRLDLDPWRGQPLIVEIDGEVEDLDHESLTIEHWQSVDRLLFAWPGESTDLVLTDRPRSELPLRQAERATSLLGSPPRATVTLGEVASPIDAPAWLWPSVAAAAAIAMFWLLARMVGRSDPASRPKEE